MKGRLMLKPSKISQAVMVLLTAGVTPLAIAQSSGLAEVTITGSNLKRADKEGTSPIQTITAQEIQQTGATNVLQLLKAVPSMGVGGYNDTPDQNGFSRGVATASLRALGSTSTLILLNGRRMTPSAYANPNNGQSTLYDLNSIPISAIERIEIFKDGASAVYGSDAMAGVINFITKTGFVGGEISTSIGANDNQEFGRRNVNGTVGLGDYKTDGKSLMLSFDLTTQNATSVRDGSFDIRASEYAAMNNRLIPYYSYVSNQPFFFKERALNSKSFFTTGTATSPNILNNVNCDPSRQLVGGSAYGIAASSFLSGRTFCNYDGDAFTDVQTAGEDFSLMGIGKFRINANLSAFGEFTFNDTKRIYRAPARTISGTSPTTNFLVGGIAEPFQAILPIGHPDNPFKDARTAVAYRFENLKTGTDLSNQNARLLGGLKGVQGEWDWESAVLWNQSRREETAYGFLYLPTLRKLITENRSLASLAADPTITKDLTNIGIAEIVQWDAKATRDIGELPGGKIGLAVGVEARQERLTIDPDPANARGDILGLSTTAIQSKRDVVSSFFEVRTPFTKTFEMDFAGRFDKYPSFKTNFVPKVGAKWTAQEGLAFRGTYSEGFRAPALSQVASGGAQFFLNGTVDPVRCPDGVTPKPGADTTDCSKSVSGVGGSNPELKPEKSKGFSLGMIYSPTKDIDVLIDTYKVRQENEVALGSATYLLEHPDRFPADAITRDTNPLNQLKDANGNPIPGTGPLIAVKTPWVNQGATEITGVDLELKSRNNLGDYGTSVGAIPRNRFTLSTALEQGSHIFLAAMKMTTSISMMRRYDGAKEYPVPYCHYGSGQPSTATSLGGVPLYSTYYPDCKVPSWKTFDVGYMYNGIKNLQLGLNISNVFDKPAPYYPGSNTSTTVQQGYSSGLYTNTGRYSRLTAKYIFN
ncbi:MAG: TonB-dependent receptor [Betaproteobacteria bacterium]|nr:TonB-dependent receptor [Betaproteobacteria bacterium]